MVLKYGKNHQVLNYSTGVLKTNELTKGKMCTVKHYWKVVLVRSRVFFFTNTIQIQTLTTRAYTHPELIRNHTTRNQTFSQEHSNIPMNNSKGAKLLGSSSEQMVKEVMDTRTESKTDKRCRGNSK